MISELLPSAHSMRQVKVQADAFADWLLTVTVASVLWHDVTGSKLQGVLEAAAVAACTVVAACAAVPPDRAAAAARATVRNSTRPVLIKNLCIGSPKPRLLSGRRIAGGHK